VDPLIIAGLVALHHRMVVRWGKGIDEIMTNGFDDLDWETQNAWLAGGDSSRAPGWRSRRRDLGSLPDVLDPTRDVNPVRATGAASDRLSTPSRAPNRCQLPSPCHSMQR
jgi:hypothetical protein